MTPPTAQAPPVVDLLRVRTQCERVRAALRALVDWIPLRPLRGEGVARWADLKGPLCRRVLAAVQHHGEPGELARILPGVEGLTLFVDALATRGAPKARVADARQAVRTFAELLHEGGGSQRRLVAGVEAALAGGGVGAGEAPEARRRLFEAASAVSGTTCDAQVVVGIVHRGFGRTAELDSVGALGHVAYRARAGAPPLVAKHWSPEGVEDVDARDDPELLQRRFGTPDLAVTRTRLDGRRVLASVEPTPDVAVDHWTGPVRNRRVTEFARGEENGYGSLAAVRVPSRLLVHDLWVEKSLAHASVLRAGVYRATPDVLGSIDYKQWYDRLPGEPRFVLPGDDLGAGLESPLPDHADVLRACFEAADLQPRGFVGYRCVVEHPIWMAIYRLTLEFDPAFDAERLG